jgi:hypothetical protein
VRTRHPRHRRGNGCGSPGVWRPETWPVKGEPDPGLQFCRKVTCPICCSQVGSGRQLPSLAAIRVAFGLQVRPRVLAGPATGSTSRQSLLSPDQRPDNGHTPRPAQQNPWYEGRPSPAQPRPAGHKRSPRAATATASGQNRNFSGIEFTPARRDDALPA